MKRKLILAIFFLISVSLVGVVSVTAQGPRPGRAPSGPMGTAFTYQGQLKNNGVPVNGNCDLAFRLYDSASGGTLVSGPITPTVTITNGLFTTQLDFDASPFNGGARWLDMQVRCPAGSGSFTPMSSREQLTPAPYALYSLTAGSVNYQNVIIVAKSGGNFATISGALNSITNASDTNRYLVKVMPGVYTESVTMKPYVDIEGVGELTTKITYTGSATTDTGTVLGANNAELRFLTVENTGGNTNAIAIYNSSSSPRLTHITASASGSSNNFGVYNYNFSASIMTNVTAIASGGTSSYGVYNTGSTPMMTNMTATASGGASANYGVYNEVRAATMTNMTACASGGAADNIGVFNRAASSPTMTNVTACAMWGTHNYGVFNYNAISPTMTNVVATASGGTSNIGVANTNCSPTMTNVTATASGGTSRNTGVDNFSSSPMMTNMTASALGGTDTIGVYNKASSPTIQNSTISASGGTSTNYGIFNSAPIQSFSVTVNNSQVTGGTNTILNDSHFITRVGASLLSGGAVNANGGTLTCVFSYNANYTALSATCQ